MLSSWRKRQRWLVSAGAAALLLGAACSSSAVPSTSATSASQAVGTAAAAAPTVAAAAKSTATAAAPTVNAVASRVAPTVQAAATNVAPTVQAAATQVAPTVNAVASQVAHTGPLTKITIVNTAVTGAYSALWTAMDAGYFQQQGLDPQIEQVTGTSRAIAVLLSNQAQFSTLDGETIVQADSTGANLRSFVGITNRMVFSIMAQPSITSPEQLKGKKLGETGAGSSTDTAARAALKIWNLQPDTDVALVHLNGVPNILAGLVAKQIDAGVLSPPTSVRAKNQGFHELIDLAKDGPPFVSVTLGTTQSYMQQHPDVVAGTARAYNEGLKRFLADKPFALKVLANHLKLNDQAVLSATYDAFHSDLANPPLIDNTAMQNTIDAVAVNTPKAKGTSPSQYIDTSVMQKVLSGG